MISRNRRDLGISQRADLEIYLLEVVIVTYIGFYNAHHFQRISAC